jgi:hypothetical protein
VPGVMAIASLNAIPVLPEVVEIQYDLLLTGTDTYLI